MNGSGLPGVRITPRKSSTCGICGTHMEVTVYGEEEREPEEVHTGHHGHAHEELHDGHHGHHHADPLHITELIRGLDLPEEVKDNAIETYNAIADAEAKAHGCPVEQVHFHEVGAIDSIVDIIAAAVCMDNLKIEEVIISQLNEGRGSVRCQHGILPIPVPAVANIAAAYQLPIHIMDCEGEFITPTGAAIAAAVASKNI